jgi:tetratricopeptide (TPR) repeat protein
MRKKSMIKRINTIWIILFFVAVFFIPLSIFAEDNPQSLLKQYISDLQKNPNDYALRENIIRHVQTMKPAPAVPEEARRYFIEGNALLKAAKEQKGYGLAIDSYRQCLLIAPWWAEAHNNYAVALELAGQFDEAVNALKLYIATNPNEGESRKAQDKIYEIGAKKKIAASEKTGISSKQNAFEELLKKIDGRRYTITEGHGITSVLDLRGRIIVRGTIENGRYLEWTGEASRVEIRGRETTVPLYYRPFKVNAVSMTLLISEDGYSITGRTKFSDGDSRDYIHLWQR